VAGRVAGEQAVAGTTGATKEGSMRSLSRLVGSIGLIAMVSMVFAAMPCAAEIEHGIGVGVHYLKAIGDIDSDFDEDGLSYVVSYRFRPVELLALQVEVEMYPDEFLGLEERMFAPQGLLVLGKVIYIGAGIGVTYYDGDFANDPFFMFRAGLELELLPSFSIDIHGNYMFTEWDDLDESGRDIDSDTITLGAAARISF